MPINFQYQAPVYRPMDFSSVDSFANLYNQRKETARKDLSNIQDIVNTTDYSDPNTAQIVKDKLNQTLINSGIAESDGNGNITKFKDPGWNYHKYLDAIQTAKSQVAPYMNMDKTLGQEKQKLDLLKKQYGQDLVVNNDPSTIFKTDDNGNKVLKTPEELTPQWYRKSQVYDQSFDLAKTLSNSETQLPLKAVPLKVGNSIIDTIQQVTKKGVSPQEIDTKYNPSTVYDENSPIRQLANNAIRNVDFQKVHGDKSLEEQLDIAAKEQYDILKNNTDYQTHNQIIHSMERQPKVSTQPPMYDPSTNRMPVSQGPGTPTTLSKDLSFDENGNIPKTIVQPDAKPSSSIMGAPSGSSLTFQAIMDRINKKENPTISQNIIPNPNYGTLDKYREDHPELSSLSDKDVAKYVDKYNNDISQEANIKYNLVLQNSQNGVKDNLMSNLNSANFHIPDMETTGDVYDKNNVVKNLGYSNLQQMKQVVNDEQLKPGIDFRQGKLVTEIPEISGKKEKDGRLTSYNVDKIHNLYFDGDEETNSMLKGGSYVTNAYYDSKNHSGDIVTLIPRSISKDYPQGVYVQVAGDRNIITGQNNKQIVVTDPNSGTQEVTTLANLQSNLTRLIDQRYNYLGRGEDKDKKFGNDSNPNINQ